jgi:hypothetical protein
LGKADERNRLKTLFFHGRFGQTRACFPCALVCWSDIRFARQLPALFAPEEGRQEDRGCARGPSPWIERFPNGDRPRIVGGVATSPGTRFPPIALAPKIAFQEAAGILATMIFSHTLSSPG